MIISQNRFDYLQEAASHLDAQSIRRYVVVPIIIQLKENLAANGKIGDYNSAQLEMLRRLNRRVVYSGAIQQWVLLRRSALGTRAMEVRLSSGKILDLASEYEDDLDSPELEKKISKYLLGRMRTAINDLIKGAVSGKDDFLKAIGNRSFTDWLENTEGMVLSERASYRYGHHHVVPFFYNGNDMEAGKDFLKKVILGSDDLSSRDPEQILTRSISDAVVDSNITQLITLLEFNKTASSLGKRVVWELNVSRNGFGQPAYQSMLVEDIVDDARPVLILHEEDTNDPYGSAKTLVKALHSYGLLEEFSYRSEDDFLENFAHQGLEAWDRALASALSGRRLGLKVVENEVATYSSYLHEDRQVYETLLRIAKNS